MYVVEIDEEMFIVDTGLMFPEGEMLGIDIVIPDITYVEENKERVKGIFLTHGHEDAIGSIAYLLQKVQAPVYGSKLTLALAKEHLKEMPAPASVKFFEVTNKSRMNFNRTHVTFFNTTHSIPDSLGSYLIQVKVQLFTQGNLNLTNRQKENIVRTLRKWQHLEKKAYSFSCQILLKRNVLVIQLLNLSLKNILSKTFHGAEGRILVALYASNFIRIQQVFDKAFETGKKVAVVGKSLESYFEVGMKLGYLQIEDDIVIPVKDIEKYADDQVVIIVTGNQR